MKHLKTAFIIAIVLIAILGKQEAIKMAKNNQQTTINKNK